MNFNFGVSVAILFLSLIGKMVFCLKNDWYSYIKNYPGITIDTNSYSIFKFNLMMLEKHNEVSINKWDMSPYFHIAMNDFSKRFNHITNIKNDNLRYSTILVAESFKELPNNKYFSWVDKTIIDLDYHYDGESWVTVVKELIESTIKIRSPISQSVNINQIAACSSNFDIAMKRLNSNPILLNDLQIDLNEKDKCIPTTIDEMMRHGFTYEKLRKVDSSCYQPLTVYRQKLDIYSSPIAISMSISLEDIKNLQFYSGSNILILNKDQENSYNYVGLIVGFGKTGSGEGYWIVKMNLGENDLFKISPFSSAIINSYQL